ncbi:VanW family protein [Oceanobacillus sp. CAU 1775]
MNKIKRLRNIFILTIVLLVSLILPTYVFASKVSDGSGVAGIPLENMTMEEARQELQTTIDVWQSGEALEAIHEQEILEIPRDIFQFDIELTLTQLEEKMKRHWSNFFMKPKNVQQELIVSLAPGAIEMLDWPASIDIEATLNYALLQASNLTENSVSLVYIEGAMLEEVEIASVSLEIPEASESTIEYLIENLNGQIIEPDSLYSFLEANALPNGAANGEIEMSFVASGLYELALQTDLAIIERHQQDQVTSYAEPGLDAKVNREENLDLRLYHTNNFSYTILAKIDEGRVELSLEAPSTAFISDYSLENEKEVKPRKIYRYNRNLGPGEEVVIQEPANGVQIEVYRLVRTEDEESVERKLVSRDFYKPIHEIIETSVETEESVEETPEDVNESTTIIDEVNNIQLTCEEDPTQCNEEGTVLLPLFLSCMEERVALSSATDEINNATALPGACDLLVFYLSYMQEDNDLIAPDLEFNEDIDEEIADFNDEQQEEVK